RGLHHRDRELVPEFVAAAIERCVARDAYDRVEVARRSAARTTRALARQAQPLAFVDARRHFDFDRTRPIDDAHAPAPLAPIRNDLAGRGTRRARRRGDDLAEQRTARLPNLARTLALRTSIGVRAGRAARAIARLALDRHAQVERLAGAEYDFFQRQ